MNKFIIAAANMDWRQVAENGGPPCFYIQADGDFCCRSYRWSGHHVDVNKHPALHKFVGLPELLKTVAGS